MTPEEKRYYKKLNFGILKHKNYFPIFLVRFFQDYLFCMLMYLTPILVGVMILEYKGKFLTTVSNIYHPKGWIDLCIVLVSLLIVLFIANTIVVFIGRNFEYKAMESVFEDISLKRIENTFKYKDPNYEFSKPDKSEFNSLIKEDIRLLISKTIWGITITLVILYLAFLFTNLEKLSISPFIILPILIVYSIYATFSINLVNVYPPATRPYEYLFRKTYGEDTSYSFALQGLKDHIGIVFSYLEGATLQRTLLVTLYNLSLYLLLRTSLPTIWTFLIITIIYAIIYYLYDFNIWNKNIISLQTNLVNKQFMTKKEAGKQLRKSSIEHSELTNISRNIKKHYKTTMKNLKSVFIDNED